MAFGTLCTSRLVHGFNCKSQSSEKSVRKMFNNKYLTGAFFIGLALITCVLILPGLADVFKVVSLGGRQLLVVYGLALLTKVGTP